MGENQVPTKSEYREYIASAEWQARRIKFLAKYRYCSECNLPRRWAVRFYDQDLHVHHESYEHIGKELDEDLRALCRRCHEIKTFGHSSLPEKNWYRPGPEFIFILAEEFEFLITTDYAKALRPIVELAEKCHPLAFDLAFAEVVRTYTYMPCPENLIGIIREKVELLEISGARASNGLLEWRRQRQL
jgi:hypothetical protein